MGVVQRDTPMLETATATTIVRDVCVSFFLPTDARHWIPNGVATIDLIIPEDWLDCDQSEWFQLLEEEAEAWCERTHGKGSFWGVIWEE